MTEQSIASKLGAKVLPFVAKQVFPQAWLDAGDDRAQLLEVAAKRRRGDGPRPDALLGRSWGRATTTVHDRQLHLLTPKGGSTGRVLFYCHGGAFVIGPSSLEWLFAAKFAKAIGCDLAVYDYAKVPEHDASATRVGTLAAYDLLADRYPESARFLAGTSAGGNLAASLALELTQNDRALPNALVLFSPWLDLTVSHPNAASYVDSDHLLPIEVLRRDGELYAGGQDPTDPLMSPRFAPIDQLRGLPPTVVTAGSDEILLPESEELIMKLVQADVDATLHVEPHGQHVGIMATTPEGGALFDEIVARVRPIISSSQ